MLPDPPMVEGPWDLRQIYPPVILKYPLVQKLIETPALGRITRVASSKDLRTFALIVSAHPYCTRN